ncbi:redoxin domain-containing protein [Sporosarcina sp. CAU 1771]
MNKRTIGMILTVLIVGTMIVLTVKSNVEQNKLGDNLVVSDAELEDLLLSEAPSKDQAIGFGKGDTPPDFELSTLSGDVIKLSDYKGKKVILNFWASWCAPCKAEMPHMENYYKKNKEKENVEIIAVNLTREETKGVTGVEQFVDAYGLTFPIPIDEVGKIMETYQVLMIPTTYLINTDGTIAHKIIAPMDEKTIGEFVGMLK